MLKLKNSELKAKFGTKTNSNRLNLMVLFDFFYLKLGTIFLGGVARKDPKYVNLR